MDLPAPHGVTSLEALGIAIRSELDSRDVYRELAARAGDPLLRRRFDLLAAEEDQHRRYLEERYAELAGGVPLRLPPSSLPPGLTTPEERGRSTLPAVLSMAIEEERRSREFYLRAARETDDPSGQSMFRYLADLEYQHWMALGQEMDMMLRYPNYGRPGPTPWRSERSLGEGSQSEGV